MIYESHQVKFKSTVTQNGNDITLRFEGAIDENVVLPMLPTPILGKLIFNLEKVTLINSLGCKTWINWVRAQVTPNANISLVACTPAIVYQINILQGFVPDHANIDSFLVPYTCDDCDREEYRLLTRGTHFDSTGITQFENTIKCPKCNGTLEMDVVKERYFRFLNRKSA